MVSIPGMSEDIDGGTINLPPINGSGFTFSDDGVLSDFKPADPIQKSIEANFQSTLSPDLQDAVGGGQFTALSNNGFSQAQTEKMANSLTSGLDVPQLPGMGATEIKSILGGNLNNDGFLKGVGIYGVRLTSQTSSEVVVFNVMPTIAENRTASYDEVPMPHHPGVLIKYNHSGARTWNVSNIKLISRTIAEADKNQEIINTLRGWMMPYYGLGTEHSAKSKLGAPPDVLIFTAYGDRNIGPIPVVLESASWTWPNDVDYIHTSKGQPFPVIFNIDVQLKEAWSPKEYSGFDLLAYKQGDLRKAYVAYDGPIKDESKQAETTPATSADANTSEISAQTPTQQAAVTDTGGSPVSPAGDAQPSNNEMMAPNLEVSTSAALLGGYADAAYMNTQIYGSDGSM